MDQKHLLPTEYIQVILLDLELFLHLTILEESQGVERHAFL